MMSGRVLWPQVWGLASVQGAIALTWVVYNLYLVDLLTQFNFPASWATGLLVLENILAALIEPITGNFSDGLQHRMGTRFPFIALGVVLASMFFLGIPLVWVFVGPEGLMRWVLPITLVAWAMAMTLFRSPALSLLGRYAFRSQLPQAASILTLVGGVAGSLAPLAGSLILQMGPVITFSIGSFTLLGAAAVLRAVGPNQSISPTETVAQSTLDRPTLSIRRLSLVFGTGLGVALGLRLLMQMLPAVLAAQVPNLNRGLVMGSIFIALAVAAIPAGTFVSRAGTRVSMVVGLGLMALLNLLTLFSSSLFLAFGIAISIGLAFSIVSNTTIPFALSMVPDHKAGLGTGMYFSGGAVALSLHGMAVSQGFSISTSAGLIIGAVAFIGAAVCVAASFSYPDHP